ncbi:ileal sodium/bile acid cotransporter-like [Anneissia japonica]|uniref:ileal sodium/bile acid cotransporter-like n=1 Tax=Anneissia japonica TaxID=1529436 RepID=UPI0014255918|nr:ileal sodium/bile acid cotransporter-like [Anneissia japonica]
MKTAVLLIVSLCVVSYTAGIQETNSDQKIKDRQRRGMVTTVNDVNSPSGDVVDNTLPSINPSAPTDKQKKPKKNNKKNKKNKNKNKKKVSPSPSPLATLLNNATVKMSSKALTTDPIPHVHETPHVHVCACEEQAENQYEMFSISFEPQILFLEEGETKSVNMTVSGLNGQMKIALDSGNEEAFQIVSNSSFIIESTSEEENITVTIRITGVRVNVAHMEVYAHGPTEQPPPFRVKTLRHLRVIDKIFDYILLPLLIITTTGMGCKMEFDIIKYKLKHPFPIIIGPVCQFICQPFYAFCIAKLLKLTPLMAVGLVTVGSCPGGGLSNMITLLADADLIQSVTMTFVSSCLAMGMLPLNMFIYVRAFVDTDNAEGGGGGVPFGSIMVQVSMLTFPVLTGMFIRHKFPKIAYYCIKSLNILSGTLILLTISIGLYSNVYVIYSPWFCFVGSLMLPSCGFITGYIVARKIGKLPIDSSATVSIETGVQNNLIAIAMIKLSYEQPEADLMARMPIFVLIFSVSIGIGMIIASIPINRKRRAKKKQLKEMKDIEDKYDKYDEYSAVSTRETNGKTPRRTPEGSNDEDDDDDDDAESLFSTTEQVSKTTNV